MLTITVKLLITLVMTTNGNNMYIFLIFSQLFIALFGLINLYFLPDFMKFIVLIQFIPFAVNLFIFLNKKKVPVYYLELITLICVLSSLIIFTFLIPFSLFQFLDLSSSVFLISYILVLVLSLGLAFLDYKNKEKVINKINHFKSFADLNIQLNQLMKNKTIQKNYYWVIPVFVVLGSNIRSFMGDKIAVGSTVVTAEILLIILYKVFGTIICFIKNKEKFVPPK